jgi:hypothetical protein
MILRPVTSEEFRAAGSGKKLPDAWDLKSNILIFPDQDGSCAERSGKKIREQTASRRVECVEGKPCLEIVKNHRILFSVAYRNLEQENQPPDRP